MDIRGTAFGGHAKGKVLMRDLQRNQVKISYKPYLGKDEIIDEYGYSTGEFDSQYGELHEMMISVSANKGDYSLQQFGDLLDYDRTMLVSDPNCPIDENARVYIDGNCYIVKAVARSLNAAQYAIKRVEINEQDDNG